MPSIFILARRHGRLVLLLVILLLAILFPVMLGLAVTAGLAVGRSAWLAMVPALFFLGRSYGTAAQQEGSGQAAYGVGAALAGFTPRGRH